MCKICWIHSHLQSALPAAVIIVYQLSHTFFPFLFAQALCAHTQHLYQRTEKKTPQRGKHMKTVIAFFVIVVHKKLIHNKLICVTNKQSCTNTHIFFGFLFFFFYSYFFFVALWMVVKSGLSKNKTEKLFASTKLFNKISNFNSHASNRRRRCISIWLFSKHINIYIFFSFLIYLCLYFFSFSSKCSLFVSFSLFGWVFAATVSETSNKLVFFAFKTHFQFVFRLGNY